MTPVTAAFVTHVYTWGMARSALVADESSRTGYPGYKLIEMGTGHSDCRHPDDDGHCPVGPHPEACEVRNAVNTVAADLQYAQVLSVRHHNLVALSTKQYLIGDRDDGNAGLPDALARHRDGFRSGPTHGVADAGGVVPEASEYLALARTNVVNRNGFSLIEVVIALSILSVVIMGLSGLMFQVAHHTRNSAKALYRTAAVQKGAAHIAALPWDQIDGAAGCTADSSGQMAYNRCISVNDSTLWIKRVTLVIAPTGVLTAPPETLLIYRNRGRTPSPLR